MALGPSSYGFYPLENSLIMKDFLNVYRGVQQKGNALKLLRIQVFEVGNAGRRLMRSRKSQ